MNSFQAFGLDPLICRSLEEEGYTSPTEIQTQAIPDVLLGRDVVASADTGTGKTAAFMLPALQLLTKESPIKSKGPRILVLTPTRELANQVSTSARKYGKYLKKIRTVSILGGMPFGPQERDLRNFVDVLVATPGRLLDHHRSGRIDFRRLELFVLDEADRMLDMGFSEDMDMIAEAINRDHQTILFSATMDRKILNLASSFTKDPKRIEVARKTASHVQIKQSLLLVNDLPHKKKLLKEILNQNDMYQAIVFTATKRSAEELAYHLRDEGINAVEIHGDMRQSKRLQAIKRIRDNSAQVLVATDVAARGIDITTISHVINFDIPRTAEDYTHRIGRTGRANAKGVAMTFASFKERGQVKNIQRSIGYDIEEMVIKGFEPTAPKKGERDSRSRSGGQRSRGNSRSYSGNRGGSNPSSNVGPRRNGRRGEQRSSFARR